MWRIQELYPRVLKGVHMGENSAQTALPGTVPEMRIMQDSSPEINTGGERRFSNPT